MSPQTLLEFAAPAQTYLLPILRESLGVCVERHQLAEGRGADNFSFFTDAWSIPARRFKDSVAEQRIPFQMHGFRGCVLALGRYNVRHHCVGWSDRDDIRVSFPRNAGAMGQEVKIREQMLLDFGEDFPPLNEPGTVVLAYMANPQEGLCAAYLATPRRVDNGRIVEWDEIVELWRRDFLLPPEPVLVYQASKNVEAQALVRRRSAEHSGHG
jgi:hypothetical protein